jgi:hypothetical protein
MAKQRKYEYDKFIKIKFIVTDQEGYFYDRYNGKLDLDETYINVEYITEITPVQKADYLIKNHNDDLYTTRELSVFSVYLSTDRRFYLLQSEYKKFKDIING